MKRIFSLLLCLLLVFQLAACNFEDENSILSIFDQWLQDGGYQVTTTKNPDGSSTTTLTPPGTTTGPTVAPTTIPTTLPTALPTTVPSPGVPTTAPTTLPTSAVPTTAPTTAAPTTAKPTTATPITAKPTTAVPTTAKPTTAKPTTAKPTTAKPTTVNPGSHTALAYTGRYLYNLLTAEEKGWYRAIDTAVRSLQDTVSLNVNLMENDRYNIYFVYMFDNPEQFYLGGRISYSSSGKLYMSYSDGTSNSYRGGSSNGDLDSLTDTMRTNIRARKSAFDAEVNRIISTIPVSIPDVEKELMIHDLLVRDMQYNEHAADNNTWDGVAEVNWTAYGGIIHKTGVCEAYAEAFQTLCYAVGINCTGIVGTANGGGHKWNAVQLEGQWYAVDVTFDDPIIIGGGSSSR